MVTSPPKKPKKIDPSELLPDGHDLDRDRTNAELLALPGDGHDLHDVLTNADVIDTRLQARAAIMEERREAARQQLLDEETNRLREQEGLVTGGPEDEVREIVIDLSKVEALALRINGREYVNGRRYTVPTHVYRTLLDMQHQLDKHEHSISGKPLSEFYRRPGQIQIRPGHESFRPRTTSQAVRTQ